MHAGKSLNKSFSWIWPAGAGVATWSIFVECEAGLGDGKRKGAVGSCLLHHTGDFWARPFVFGTLWLSRWEWGLTGWNGEVAKRWVQDPTLLLSGYHLQDSLQEGKQMFVQLCGNIQSYDKAVVCFLPVKSVSQMRFPYPSKLALLVSLDHHTCSFVVAVPYQLSVPESCSMSSKTSDT